MRTTPTAAPRPPHGPRTGACPPATLLPLLAALWACGDTGPGGNPPPPLAAEDFCAHAAATMAAFLDTFPAPAEGRYGGTAVVAGSADLSGGMNALTSAGYAAAQHQAFVTLMTLVRYDEALRTVPYLARAWELSPEGTSLTFHLRDDVYWHDGTRVSAHDVAFTYRRAADPETGFPNRGYFDAYLPGDEGVTVEDSLTVVFRFRPHAEPLDAWRSLRIMPRHLLGDVAPAELQRHPFGRCPVGNGPFRFVSHRADDRWVFRANPAFPPGLGGRPFLDRYVYRVIPEPGAALTELLAGEVDVYLNPPADHAPRIEAAPDARLLHYPFRDYTLIAWNGRRPPLDDARVRRALTLGIDRQEIVDVVLRGYGAVANSGVPPFHWAYDPELAGALLHDPDTAAALLRQAGWVDRDGDGVREDAAGRPLRLSLKYNHGNENRKRSAEVVQAQLARIGVRVVPEVLEWQTLVAQITDAERRDFDGVLLAYVADFRVDERDLFHSRNADEPYGFAGLRDPALDALLDSLPGILDRAEARSAWVAYQRRILELQPFTYLYFAERLDGVRDRLRDVHMDVRGEWVSIARWWIPPAARRGARDG